MSFAANAASSIVRALARGLLTWERVRHGAALDLLEAAADPYPQYARLRDRDPIHRSPLLPGYVVSRYEDVLEGLRRPELSADERYWKWYGLMNARRRQMGLPEAYEDGAAFMLRVDPPDHTRLRRLVNRAFTPRAVERMQGRVESIAAALLDDLPDEESLDLVRDFAAPLPVIVIAEMLGVPAEDHRQFREWSEDAVRVVGFSDAEDVRASLTAQQELRRYIEDIVEHRRVEPRDDLISGLVAAEEEGDQLTLAELFAQTLLILVAGNETTTKLIGNGMLALLRHPEQLELLRREPERTPNAVEELLRYDSPVQFTSRMVREDGEFGGRPIWAGNQIILLLGSANRDPAMIEEPNRLDITRDEIPHLSFSHGAHFCLGAQLARLEAVIAFRTLLDRFPTIELATSSVDWSDNIILRGPTRLDLRVKRRAAAA